MGVPGVVGILPSVIDIKLFQSILAGLHVLPGPAVAALIQLLHSYLPILAELWLTTDVPLLNGFTAVTPVIHQRVDVCVIGKPQFPQPFKARAGAVGKGAISA